MNFSGAKTTTHASQQKAGSLQREKPRLDKNQPGSCLIPRMWCGGIWGRWGQSDLSQAFRRLPVVMPFLFDENGSPTSDAGGDARRA